MPPIPAHRVSTYEGLLEKSPRHTNAREQLI